MARIDRLPQCNTIEATRTLSQAWDSVDLFTDQARRSKLIAKMSYALLLLVGAAATVVTVISLNRPAVIDADLRGALVIALSVAGTALASWTTYMDPVQRWTQLQGSARPSPVASLCIRFTRAGIEWCRCHHAVCMARPFKEPHHSGRAEP